MYQLFVTYYPQLTTTQNPWPAPSCFLPWLLASLYSIVIIITDIFCTLNPSLGCILFKGRGYICEQSLTHWLWLGRDLIHLSLNRESLTNSIGKWGCFWLVLYRGFLSIILGKCWISKKYNRFVNFRTLSALMNIPRDSPRWEEGCNRDYTGYSLWWLFNLLEIFLQTASKNSVLQISFWEIIVQWSTVWAFQYRLCSTFISDIC